MIYPNDIIDSIYDKLKTKYTAEIFAENIKSSRPEEFFFIKCVFENTEPVMFGLRKTLTFIIQYYPPGEDGTEKELCNRVGDELIMLFRFLDIKNRVLPVNDKNARTEDDVLTFTFTTRYVCGYEDDEDTAGGALMERLYQSEETLF